MSIDFLNREHGLHIAGGWQPSDGGGRLDVINPATGAVISTIADASPADVDRAVAAARAAFERNDWASLLPNARGQLLWRIAEAIEAHAEEFARLECLDNGKPLLAARRGDVPGAADTFRYFAGWCTKITGQTMQVSRPGQTFAYTMREPLGVVAAIVPWNFPLLMAAWKLAPALAAGCTVVLKPAEDTSLTALRLAEVMADCGLPAGVVNVVTGRGATVGATLTRHPDVNKVAFTGSTLVGKEIIGAAAGNLKKLTLELGGKSPTLILPDADLAKAIPAAAMGIFHNAGQVCAAGSRLYVHEKVFDQVAEGIIQRARALRSGPGEVPTTDLGPLVSQRHRERVHGYVESGQREGAQLLTGGARGQGEGFFYEPTILTGTTSGMSIVREEIFGPVLVAERFGDLDEAVERANDSDFGLSATVWTTNLGLAHGLARRLEAGTIRVNTGGGTDPNQPFGGTKQSGWGREFGEEGLLEYMQTKSVLMTL
ncbi:aldehyde dehydrogenase family protein [Pararhodobacter sp.]|uniref:aldehyde dehydrogenase family protein n=1 Tax=Pararhodobacter sp. TaxID=2127056 RepID=UPI002FE19A3E